MKDARAWVLGVIAGANLVLAIENTVAGNWASAGTAWAVVAASLVVAAWHFVAKREWGKPQT